MWWLPLTVLPFLWATALGDTPIRFAAHHERRPGTPTPIPDLSPCPIEKSPMNPQWALKTEPGAGVGLHFKEIFSKIFPAIKPSDLSSGNISTSALHGGFVCGFPPKFLVEYLLTKVSQFKFGLFFLVSPPGPSSPFPPFPPRMFSNQTGPPGPGLFHFSLWSPSAGITGPPACTF